MFSQLPKCSDEATLRANAFYISYTFFCYDREEIFAELDSPIVSVEMKPNISGKLDGNISYQLRQLKVKKGEDILVPVNLSSWEMFKTLAGQTDATCWRHIVAHNMLHSFGHHVAHEFHQNQASVQHHATTLHTVVPKCCIHLAKA